MIDVPLSALWGEADDPTVVDILWKLRIPARGDGVSGRLGLATSGMAFQAMFRNPLATPFTLGVSSGASLGLGAGHPPGRRLLAGWAIPAVTLFAFAGAVLTIVPGLRADPDRDAASRPPRCSWPAWR